MERIKQGDNGVGGNGILWGNDVDNALAPIIGESHNRNQMRPCVGVHMRVVYFRLSVGKESDHVSSISSCRWR